MKEVFKDNKHQESAIEAAATIDAVLRVQTNWKELWFYQKAELQRLRTENEVLRKRLGEG